MSASRTKISPRIRVREEDSLPKRMPATGDTGLFVGLSEPYNDKQTHIFDATSVSYPSMLPVGHPDADVTGIVATGRPRPGTADTHRTIFAGTVAPFKEESTLSSQDTIFASSSLGPTFQGPLSSRIAINIDITPSEETYVFRCPEKEVLADPGGEFYSQGVGTGFAYFNFASKKWDMIGRNDLVTGQPAPLNDMTMCSPFLGLRSGPKYELVITGNDRYMGQFVPPNHSNQRSWEYYTSPSDTTGERKRFDYSQQIALGSKKVGTPTTSFFAPFATKYHASKDHVLRMSDYINSPFLLERVDVEIPVQVRRRHARTGPGQDDIHMRDMDNYVFFLYRQQRNAAPYVLRTSGTLVRDSDTDITGSERFLIASASACFYNARTIDVSAATFTSASSAPTYTGSIYPFHSPAFKHDFNMNPTAAGISSTYEGTLRLSMVPNISPKGKSGVSIHPFRDPNLDRALCHLQHAWPGTAGSLTFGANEFAPASGKSEGVLTPTAGSPLVYSGSSQYKLAPYYLSLTDLESYAFKSGGSLTTLYMVTSGSRILDSDYPDPRSYLGVYGSGEHKGVTLTSDLLEPGPGTAISYKIVGNITPRQDYNFYGAASVHEKNGTETPIVLQPSDELVLGLDAGITFFANITSKITGSFMRMMTESSRITLYGSQIVNGERRPNSRRLETMGDSVSFDVSSPTLDEFLLDPPTMTYGNYSAIHVSGDIGNRLLQTWVPPLPQTPRQFTFPVFYPGVDYFRYPRFISALDARAKPLDTGSLPRRYVFRNDRFGSTANLLYASPDIAVKQTSIADGVGFVRNVSGQEYFTVTNVFTGSTAFTRNTSLHATSSGVFFDS